MQLQYDRMRVELAIEDSNTDVRLGDGAFEDHWFAWRCCVDELRRFALLRGWHVVDGRGVVQEWRVF